MLPQVENLWLWHRRLAGDTRHGISSGFALSCRGYRCCADALGVSDALEYVSFAAYLLVGYACSIRRRLWCNAAQRASGQFKGSRGRLFYGSQWDRRLQPSRSVLNHAG